MQRDGLTIQWAGGERTFEPATTVRIGRDQTATIRLSSDRVSRAHAEVRCTAGVWTLADLNSTGGTYLNGNQVSTVVVDGPITVRLGSPTSGDELTLSPHLASARAGVDPTVLPSSGFADPTEIPPEPRSPQRQPQRPGGTLNESTHQNTIVAGDELVLELSGHTHSLTPGQDVVIGRDPAAAVATTNPAVSRRHARVFHDGTHWIIEDLGSARGTFRDHQRVQRAEIIGSTAFWLGPTDVGERLVAIAAGNHVPTVGARARRLGVPLLAAVGAAAVAIAIAVFALTRAGGGGGGEPDLEALARSTVQIHAVDADGNAWSGSGTVLSADGLILTNAHVAAPDAPGAGVGGYFGKPARRLEVFVTTTPGEAAEPMYIAEVVAADGYLDLAVIQVTETVNGRIIEDGEDLGLRAQPIGDSDDMSSGDPIWVLGFPGAARSEVVTVKSGVIGSQVADRRIDANRAYLNIDVDINPGNSGGLAADEDGRMIGVPTQDSFSNGDDTETVAQMRPVDLALPLIEAAEAGEVYVSPWVTPVTDEELTVAAFVEPGRVAFERTETAPTATAAGDLIAVELDFAGFPEGHQDVVVAVWDEAAGEYLGSTNSADHYPVAWGTKGRMVVTIPLSAPLQTGGTYSIDVFAGPNLDKLLTTAGFTG